MSGLGKGVSGMVGISQDGVRAGTFPDIAQPAENHAPNFPNGISSISQASGQEFKAFQSIGVVVIAGHDAVTPAIMKVVCSLLDYIFITQSPIISATDLQFMKMSLECVTSVLPKRN